MSSKITFFPVDNGDMALIKLSDKTTILIDINIRQAAEDQDDPTCDVNKELRNLLEKDENGRPFVDVFLLSHPDQDHCNGLRRNFHLGPIDDYNLNPPKGENLKIVISEMWSSPLVFRRASKNHTLCEDAKAFNKEAKRRVKLFKEKTRLSYGSRIIIIGEDENGKTDGLEDILKKVGVVFNTINGKLNNNCSMRVLGPLPIQDDQETEEKISKNHSSIIIQFCLASEGKQDACLFLTGGDAEVYIWEKLWEENKDKPLCLTYDLLLSPHHCSWHALSYDSWSDSENPIVSDDAKSALAQTCDGAFIIASSKPIKDDANDPPCWGAKQEYLKVLKKVNGEFYCTGEYPNKEKPEPLSFQITKDGPQPPSKKSASLMGPAIITGSTREPVYHG